jgi:hypothetical protein
MNYGLHLVLAQTMTTADLTPEEIAAIDEAGAKGPPTPVIPKVLRAITGVGLIGAIGFTGLKQVGIIR